MRLASRNIYSKSIWTAIRTINLQLKNLEETSLFLYISYFAIRKREFAFAYIHSHHNGNDVIKRFIFATRLSVFRNISGCYSIAQSRPASASSCQFFNPGTGYVGSRFPFAVKHALFPLRLVACLFIVWSKLQTSSFFLFRKFSDVCTCSFTARTSSS